MRHLAYFRCVFALSAAGASAAVVPSSPRSHLGLCRDRTGGNDDLLNFFYTARLRRGTKLRTTAVSVARVYSGREAPGITQRRSGAGSMASMCCVGAIIPCTPPAASPSTSSDGPLRVRSCAAICSTISQHRMRLLAGALCVTFACDASRPAAVRATLMPLLLDPVQFLGEGLTSVESPLACRYVATYLVRVGATLERSAPDPSRLASLRLPPTSRIAPPRNAPASARSSCREAEALGPWA